MSVIWAYADTMSLHDEEYNVQVDFSSHYLFLQTQQCYWRVLWGMHLFSCVFFWMSDRFRDKLSTVSIIK